MKEFKVKYILSEEEYLEVIKRLKSLEEDIKYANKSMQLSRLQELKDVLVVEGKNGETN